MDLLAELGNDFDSGDQPEELSSDKGAPQATSEGGNATDVAFVDDCIVEVAVVKVRTVSGQLAPWTISPRRLAPSLWTISPQPTNLEINYVLALYFLRTFPYHIL